MNKIVNVSQKARQVKKLMTLSLSLFPPCKLPSPPSSPPLLHRLPLTSLSLSTVRMSSSTNSTTIDGGGNGSTVELDHIFKLKKTLRSKVRKSLKEMDPSQRSHEDDVIQSTILNAPWFQSSRSLCAYISCHSLREVDTSKIISEILQGSDKDTDKVSRKTLYVPRVEDKNSHMRMLNISGLHDLVANSMNILEPAPTDSEGTHREDVMQASQPLDLLLLPGLAFDKSGRRLGRGGGYYDTFLSNYQQLAKERNWKQPLLVALSYSPQILDNGVIPITPNDVFIDALVTSAGIIPISSAALSRMGDGV